MWENSNGNFHDHSHPVHNTDINEDFLNEIAIHLRTMDENSSLRFYGITKDPETHKYVMVLRYLEGGNLRNFLDNNLQNINWRRKLYYLNDLAWKFKEIHELDIIHQDFHPGNILSHNFKDFTSENPQKRNIFGVLPYMAPEVLGGGEYTKAADVYSFAIVAYEIIIELRKYYLDYVKNENNNNYEITIKIKEAVKLFANQTTTDTIPLNYQTHPQAIYTSRLLDFSNLPKPKNEENFERELEELTESFSYNY
ncbi:hypothetical protein Glove_71g78 [Diversispora epigaea]|uniref:Protein kinase domain-containing protein n=1 Tax=Diversispora epigaea TaxID=1348612 RepID=A0A397JJC1_9GLOM|nr:hypothetical protein Glove_71g78 [Diversispora epigaea]